MKKLTMLLLALVLVLALSACGCKHEWLPATCDTPKTCELCGKTMGTPRDHSIVEATCEEPRHCENCDAKLGQEPLGHNWSEATTEAPMTCLRCGDTEGERIITDPRFTTADTMEVQGKWVMELPMNHEVTGIPDFPDGASINVIVTFENDGEYTMEYSVSENFMDLLMQYTLDTTYAQFAADGMDAAAVDAMFEGTYGMPIEDYIEQTFANMDMEELLGNMLTSIEMDGVYYVEHGILFTGESWDAEMVQEGILMEYGTLKIESIAEVFGDEYAFTRAEE